MRVQVDKGNICTFWADALANIVLSSADTNTALWSQAATHLLGALHVNTGAILSHGCLRKLHHALHDRSVQRQQARCSESLTDVTMVCDSVLHALTWCTGAYLDQIRAEFLAEHGGHDMCSTASDWSAHAHVEGVPWTQQDRSGHEHTMTAYMVNAARLYTVRLPGNNSTWPSIAGPNHVLMFMLVRGAGLVASACGLLVRPKEVQQLVAQWSQGPWGTHMRPVDDYSAFFQIAHGEEACLTRRRLKKSATGCSQNNHTDWGCCVASRSLQRDALMWPLSVAGGDHVDLVAAPLLPAGMLAWSTQIKATAGSPEAVPPSFAGTVHGVHVSAEQRAAIQALGGACKAFACDLSMTELALLRAERGCSVQLSLCGNQP